MAPTLPPGWKSQLSVTNQELYYVNTITNERQWTVPAEPAQSSSRASLLASNANNKNFERSSGDEDEDPFADQRKNVKVCYTLSDKKPFSCIFISRDIQWGS